MCSDFSYCHGRSIHAISVPLHHVARLLLAQGANHELTTDERAELSACLTQRHQALQAAVQAYYHPGSPPVVEQLAEEMLTELLAKPCCQQSLRQHVSLAEALGLAQPEKWEEVGCGRD